MSHPTQLKHLTNELVHKFLANSKGAAQIEASKRVALRTFAGHRAARINQFDVDARLTGLEEKFRILNNDELADALRSRLDALSAHLALWTPEILAVFLQLSDKPAEGSSVQDLDSDEVESRPTPLTWNELSDDDSLSNKDGIWENVDFAANNSEEEYSAGPTRTPSPKLTSTSSNGGELEIKIGELTVSISEIELQEGLISRFWQTRRLSLAGSGQQSKITITEPQLIRESLSMLRGLPTTVYVLSETGEFVYSRQYCIRDTSEAAVAHVLNTYAEVGTKLRAIRSWTRRPEAIPIQQTFQTALNTRIRFIDRHISHIDSHLLSGDKTITLASAASDIWNMSHYMIQVAELLHRLNRVDVSCVPFKVLEFLYDTTCLNQSIGDIGGYTYFAKLFLECFLTYLKPVQIWMESGDLATKDQVFFVSKEHREISADCFWRDQFALVHTREGLLHAPRFLHLSAQKILNTGKSVNFLRRLGQGTSRVDILCSTPNLGLKDVFLEEGPHNLALFSELFDVALNDWISRRYYSSSTKLRLELDSQCGLQSSLDALEYIFFCRNGAISSRAVTAVFNRLDQSEAILDDPFVLTETFRSAFSALPCIDIRRITIRCNGSSRLHKDQRRSVKAFERFTTHYPLTWSVANIIRPESSITYQQILTLLIQVQRAKTILEQRRSLATMPSSFRMEQTTLHVADSLRHRLLWLTNSLLAYLTNVVLSASTSRMRQDLANTEDVDKMIEIHGSYLARLKKQCLLCEKLAPIRQAIIALLDLAVSFADAHASWTDQMLAGSFDRPARTSITRPDIPRHRSRRAISASSDSDEFESLNYDHEPENGTFGGRQDYLTRLKTMHQTFTRLHEFVLAGLHGVHRAGNESCWETLADILTYSVEKNQSVSNDG